MSDAPPKAATALEMAARQRDISVSEFFLKNRHLLGFDTPTKALVVAVKEAVDNALDACEEAGILPEIRVEVSERAGECRIVVEDNGPGIVESQIARIFGKLLYGSKFHKLSQSRGQQGMGISAAGMYAQLTLARPLHILSRTEGDALASEMHVSVDTARNLPDIHRKRRVEWDRPHGTRVEMEMEAHDQPGPRSVETYLRQCAIANPHVTVVYRNPAGVEMRFERSVHELPPLPREIKPHPHGIELGRLIHMLSNTGRRTLLQFLVDEFSGVGRVTALRMIAEAKGGISQRSLPKRIAHSQAAALHRAMQRVPVIAPRTDCLVPIGEANLISGLRKEIDADFLIAATRPAAVYRGNPFQVEVAIALGHSGAPEIELDQSGHLQRKKGAQRAAAESSASPTGCRCCSSNRAAPSPRPSSAPTGAITASTSPRAGCRWGRSPSSCMSHRSGFPTHPNPRRRSSPIPKSSRKSGWGCRNAGGPWPSGCNATSACTRNTTIAPTSRSSCPISAWRCRRSSASMTSSETTPCESSMTRSTAAGHSDRTKLEVPSHAG